MNRNVFKTYIFLMIFCLFYGCSQTSILTKQARNYYTNKQYINALNAALNALSLDKTYQKAVVVILNTFPDYIQEAKQIIQNYQTQSAEFIDLETVEIRKNIIEKLNEIERFQQKIINFNIKIDAIDYTQKISEAKILYEQSLKDAAEFCYKKAEQLVKLGGIDNNKIAAKWYLKCNLYVNNYKDAKTKYLKAKSAGLKRIAIIFENKTYRSNYDYMTEFITDGITEAIIKDKDASDFVEIITRQNLNNIIEEQKLQYSGLFDEKKSVQIGKIAGVNELLIGSIINVYLDPGQITSNSYKIVNNNYLEGYQKVKNQKGEWVDGDPIYKTYEGYVTKYTFKALAKIQCSYKFIDIETGKIKETEQLYGSYEVEQSWGKFSGSEKVFEFRSKDLVVNILSVLISKRPNEADYELCHRPEPYRPTNEELIDKALNNVKQKMIDKIIMYAK